MLQLRGASKGLVSNELYQINIISFNRIIILVDYVNTMHIFYMDLSKALIF